MFHKFIERSISGFGFGVGMSISFKFIDICELNYLNKTRSNKLEKKTRCNFSDDTT